MALVRCPECNNEVSSNAAACPHCGFAVQDYLRKQKNDKQNGGLIGLVLIGSVVCCAGVQINDCMDERAAEQKKKERAEAINKAREKAINKVKADPTAQVEKIKALIKQGKTKAARDELHKLRIAGHNDETLAPLIQAKEKEMAEQAKIKAEEQRKEGIKEGITLAKDCKQWQKAWSLVKTIQPEDKEHKLVKNKIVPKLDRCRKKDIRDTQRALDKVMAAQRVNIGKNIDSIFLDNNMDVRIKTYGKNKTKIRLTYVFFSNRVWIKKMTDAGLLTRLEKVGFKRVTFSDGFGRSTYYDLSPPSSKEANEKVWREKGFMLPLAVR